MLDLTIYLNALIALFVIIDPIGAALIFHAMIPQHLGRHRVNMAFKSTLITLALLILFGNFGEPLLKQLGISIDALRISGGLLLFFTAYQMITQDTEQDAVAGTRDISVFPLAIPLLAGPGSLTLAILLYSQGNHMETLVSVSAAIISICFLTMLLMLTARQVAKVIGKTGDDILRRFLGMLLAALAIQFIHDGLSSMISQSGGML